MHRIDFLAFAIIGLSIIAACTGCLYPREAPALAFSESPLHVAVRDGSVSKARSILSEDTSSLNSEVLGLTPLALAASLGNVEMIDLLIASGAEVKQTASASSPRTPLSEAAQYGETEVVRRLIAAGAEPNEFHGGMEPPLFVAVDGGQVSTAQVLLEAGADVDAVGCAERPINRAIMRGNRQVCNLLLRHGANVSAGDQYGAQPLHNAVVFGHKDMAALLLTHGANVNGRDHQDHTPLHVAAQMDRPDFVIWLVERGADVHARNFWNNTPLAIAESKLKRMQQNDKVGREYVLRTIETIANLKRLGAKE